MGGRESGATSAAAATTVPRPADASGTLPHHDDLMHPASHDQALDAVRAFRAEHGRLPRWREWERATAARPCAKTIERRWGWHELLAEAIGVRPNDVNVSWDAVLDDRAQAMLAAHRAARDELGRWPTAAEWG